MNDNRFELVTALQDHDRHDRQAARQRLETHLPPRTLLDFKQSAKYFRLDKNLEIAINMALAVGAPLLLTGEPGTGKTQVAYYLGWYFDDIPVFAYQVRSTSTAEDMKYDFDAVAYLRTAQGTATGKASRRQDFLRQKALWQAYECPTPSVLLIDEIDKAPRDFPNDLLLELDKHRFRHPFEDRDIAYSAPRPPIVVITSNAERRLPDAFLRRCIYYHIELTEELVRAALAAWNRNPDFPDTRAIQEGGVGEIHGTARSGGYSEETRDGGIAGVAGDSQRAENHEGGVARLQVERSAGKGSVDQGYRRPQAAR